jgi:hypothetical protein
MADNKLLPATGTGTTNVTTRTKDRSGIDTPIMALDLNPAGSESLMAGVMPTGGDVAHDAANSGNPILNGAEAIAHGTNPTAVAAGDRTKVYANRAGVPFVMGGHPNIQTIEYRWTTAQTDDAIVSVSSGMKIVVTRVFQVLDEATTVGVAWRLGFGASTLPTLATDGNTAAGIIASHPGSIPGGGASIGDGSGILGVGADGEDLRITAEAPTSGDARLYISYYTVES